LRRLGVIDPLAASFLRRDRDARRLLDGQGNKMVQVSTDADGEVEVAHTGLLYVVDGTGVVRLTWPFGVSSSDIANDLRILLAEGTPA
jgi:cytochrome oxidase Cu insertion factor (SCO1/SenC/PrrC family)